MADYTFREYVEKLAKHLEDNPEHADLQVIYSSDDEGNSYYDVYREGPVPGIADGEYGGEFLNHEEDLEEHMLDNPGAKINAICIN